MASMSDETPIVLIPLAAVENTAPPPETEFEHLLAWVGDGLERMEQLPDERTRDEIFALLDGIDAVHRQMLGRLIERMADLGGPELVDQVARDPTVRTLFEMYDLFETDAIARIEQALQNVYPYIESHGGHLELLGVEDGRVRVRLSGSCGDCPGSSVTLARVVETALHEGYPGFRALVSELPTPMVPDHPANGRAPVRRPRWASVAHLDDVADGDLRAVWPEGTSILIARLGDEVYAYLNGCPPGSALALQTGRLEGTTLICPWHGCRYDIRTGKRLDGEGKLGVLPVAVHDGEIKIAIGTEEVLPE